MINKYTSQVQLRNKISDLFFILISNYLLFEFGVAIFGEDGMAKYLGWDGKNNFGVGYQIFLIGWQIFWGWGNFFGRVAR